MMKSARKSIAVLLAALLLMSCFAVMNVTAAVADKSSAGAGPVYLDASACTTGEEAWYAWTWKTGGSGSWVKGENDASGYIVFNTVSDNILFARINPKLQPDWENGSVWNQTNDSKVTDNLYVIDGWGEYEGAKMNGHFDHYDGGGDDPIPTETEDNKVIGDGTIYLDARAVSFGNEVWYAWTWADGADGYWAEASEIYPGVYKYDNMCGNVTFARMNPEASGIPRWNDYEESDETKAVWNQTGDLTVDDEMYTIEGWGEGWGAELPGYWGPFEISTETVTETEAEIGENTVYLDASACTTGEEAWYAWTWGEKNTGYWSDGTEDENGYLKFENICENVIFARMNPLSDGVPRWNEYGEADETKAVWNQTDDLTIDDQLFIIEGWGSDEYPNLPGYWAPLEQIVTETETETETESDTDPTETETKPTEPSSETVPTDPAEADEDTNLYVSAKSNVNITGSKVKTNGEKITVSYSLKAAEKLVDGMITIWYDSSKLTLQPQYNTASTMFPVIKDATYNLSAKGGAIKINFSNLENKYDFTGGDVLVNIVFTKKTPTTVGTALVYMDISDLTAENTSYINNNKIFNKVTVSQTVTSGTIEEPTETAVATDPSVNLTVKASSNYSSDIQSIAVTKSTVRVNYKLTVPEIISYGKGVVTYDSTKLALESKYNSSATMFSTLNSNVVYNLKAAHETMMFTFTSVDAATKQGTYDFRNGGDVISLVFTVKSGASGTADVNLQLLDLGSISKDYYENGVKKADGASGSADIQGEEASTAPTEEDTTLPTETFTQGDTDSQPQSDTETNPSESDTGTVSESETVSVPDESESESMSESESVSEYESESQIESVTETQKPTETTTDAPKPTETEKVVPKNPTAKEQKEALEKGADAGYAVDVLKNTKTDEPAGTVFQKIKAKATKVTKSSIKLTWSKPAGAAKYIIMGNKCGKKADGTFNAYKKIKTVTSKSINITKAAGAKLKKNTYYKFIVMAVNKSGKVVSTSKTIHVATTGGKYTNAKSVKVNAKVKKNKITLKKDKTFKLNASYVKANKKLTYKSHRAIKYETSKKSVATVTKKGVIKAKKKGTAYIYAYAQNGVYRKIKVTVT